MLCFAFMTFESEHLLYAVLCLVAQLCPTLCDPMDYRLPSSCVHRDSPGKNIWVLCHALLQGIFPTQGSNPGLPHFRQIIFCLCYQGSSKVSIMVVYTHFWSLLTLNSLLLRFMYMTGSYCELFIFTAHSNSFILPTALPYHQDLEYYLVIVLNIIIIQKDK